MMSVHFAIFHVLLYYISVCSILMLVALIIRLIHGIDFSGCCFAISFHSWHSKSVTDMKILLFLNLFLQLRTLISRNQHC